MSNHLIESRNEIDDEPEEGEIQDDEGSLEDVSSDDEIPTIGKRQKSEIYASTVKLLQSQFAKRGRQQQSSTSRREMGLCPSETTDSTFKKRQRSSRSGSRKPGMHNSYFDAQRYKSSKEHIQKITGKVHEKENKVKEAKKSRRRSTSFHGSGCEQRSTYIVPEHIEPYFSPTSSKGLWHKGDMKDKRRKKKKNAKSNKTNNPLMEVYESQLKSGKDSSSVDTCVKSSVILGEENTQLSASVVEKEKPKFLSLSPSSSEIEILEVPVIIPEIITIIDSDEELQKKDMMGVSDVQMGFTEEDKGNRALHTSVPSSPVNETLENEVDDHDDNLEFLREAALNSSKPEKCLNASRDDEVLQLRLEALRSAIIRKFEERKKRGITLTKSSRIAGEEHVMSISPLGSPNHCSSAGSTAVDEDLNSLCEFNDSSNHPDVSDHANDSEEDKISTIDMELAESDEEKEPMCTGSGEEKTVVGELDESSNINKVENILTERQPNDANYLMCSTDDHLTRASSQCNSSPSVPVEISEAPLGYIIGDQEETVDSEQEIHSSQPSPVHFLLSTQSEIILDKKGSEDVLEFVKSEILPLDPRHKVLSSDQILNEEENNKMCSPNDKAISTSILQSGCCKAFELEKTKCKNDEIIDVSSRSDCSHDSTVSGELDLESMIVLDEIGGCSDDAKSEISDEGYRDSSKFLDCPCDVRNVSENCDSTDNAEFYEVNSEAHLNSLLSNSRSSSDIVHSHSDNYEVSEDNTDLFENRSIIKLHKVVSDLKSTVGTNIHSDLSNISVCEDNRCLLKEHSNDKSHIISPIDKSSNELPSQKAVDNLSLSEQCNKSGNVLVCGKTDISCSDTLCRANMRVSDIISQKHVSADIYNVAQEISIFSSEENEISTINCDNITREDSCHSLQVFSSVCDDTVIPSPSLIMEPDKEESQFGSLEVLSQKEPAETNTNTIDTGIAENVSSNTYNSADEEESSLRDSLLAMLKKRTEQLSKQKQENISALNSKCANLHAPSQNINETNSRSTVPIVSPCTSHTENFTTCDPSTSNNKSTTSVLRRVPAPTLVPSSSEPSQQRSSIRSMSRAIVYQSLNSSLNRRGTKGGKHRVNDIKASGRFNVNVPKLVIHLGEDSDSGEDNDKCDESLEPVLSSNFNRHNLPEESRDNGRGTQPVPPDFEKKLDMLLKQARFQQEVNTKEVRGVLSENTKENQLISMHSKVITFPSSNFTANVDRNLCVPDDSSSTERITSVNKLPLVAQDVSGQGGKNIDNGMPSREKNTSIENAGEMIKISQNRITETSKQDSLVRTKHVSTFARPGTSVSSAVDIRLLPSCKQKEYIQLKKQLAQLARKETGKKVKDNMMPVNTSRSLVKKSVMEEGKLQGCSTVRNSAMSSNVGLSAARSPFTRKFVKRGQGGSLLLRNEFGKSRRVVRTVPSTYNLQTHLRNRLTVSSPNKVASISSEGSLVARRVLCVPQKKIVTAVAGVKKVTSDIQITTPNVNVNDDKQRKLVGLFNRTTKLCASVVDKSCAQAESSKGINDGHEGQVSGSASNSSDVKIVCIGKDVCTLKRKGSIPEHNGVPACKKVAIQPGSSCDLASEETYFPTTDNNSETNLDSEVKEGSSKLNENALESSTGKSNYSVKRKKSNSEFNKVLVRKKSMVTRETSKEQAKCGHDSIKEIVDRTLAENLWASERKLISKRYQVLEDIATVQLNLHEIGKVNQIKGKMIRDIQRLKKELSIAESHLSKEDGLLKVLFSEVENAKRDIMRKQSETLLLSVECEEMGCKVYGSDYNVPNSCTDLIRNGMATISNTLQNLTSPKTAIESDSEMSLLCSSGELLASMTDVSQLNSDTHKENVKECSEDSNKHIPCSYSSPLEAIRTGTESCNDIQAVLCPYHIMGSCKDKECSYLH